MEARIQQRLGLPYPRVGKEDAHMKVTDLIRFTPVFTREKLVDLEQAVDLEKGVDPFATRLG